MPFIAYEDTPFSSLSLVGNLLSLFFHTKNDAIYVICKKTPVQIVLMQMHPVY